MSQWYLLRAATRQEARAVRSLKEAGLFGYCPMRTVWNRAAKEKDATRQTALFPGYIFAMLPDGADLPPARDLEGVHAFVRTATADGEKVILPIHLRFVERVIMCEALGMFDDTYTPPKTPWKPEEGETVIGIAGAMDGYVGEIVKVRGEKRLKVLFQMVDEIGRAFSKSWNVSRDEIEPMAVGEAA